MYGTFNDTPSGKAAKEQVRHGDITHLSIFANQIRQVASDVIHGKIREVSLVFAGANPGAYIDDVVMAHGEDYDGEVIMYNDEPIELGEEVEHACGGGSPSSDQKKLKKEEKKDPGMEQACGGGSPSSDSKKLKDADKSKKKMSQADPNAEEGDGAEGGETVEDIFNTLTPKQKEAVYAIVGAAAQGGAVAQSEDFDINDVVHGMSDDEINELMDALEKEGVVMAHSNVFEGAEPEAKEESVISHSELMDVIDSARRNQSTIKDELGKFAYQNDKNYDDVIHGITNVGDLFPDYKKLQTEPTIVSRKIAWVDSVMSGVSHSPFSRIKTMHADLREDEARAKGYIKGNQKLEEVFPVYNRITGPTTVYKKQVMDRDDVQDITDFDVIAWLKKEMRVMLDEEIARAILIGDGRNVTDQDKINEQNVRPIWTDDDLYVIRHNIKKDASQTKAELARELIAGCIRSRKEYRGSGNLTLFIGEDMLAEMLLIEDLNQRRIYKDESELAIAMRVKKIVTVPQFDTGLKYTPASGQQGAGIEHTLLAIAVDMSDYNVGADKGGNVAMFDDFDIDFNKQKYLIETRLSGALKDPFTAIAFNTVPANSNNNNSKKQGK